MKTVKSKVTNHERAEHILECRSPEGYSDQKEN